MAFVYILKCRNNRFYIGSTDNLKRRISEHNSGKSTYTKNLLPIELIFSQELEDLKEARKMELWIKKQKSADFLRRIILEGKIKKLF